MRIQPSYAKGANLLKHLFKDELSNWSPSSGRTVRVAERLETPSLITGSRVRISLEAIFFPNLLKRRFIAQSLSRSSVHHPEMTEILLKGRKTQNWSILSQAGNSICSLKREKRSNRTLVNSLLICFGP